MLWAFAHAFLSALNATLCPTSPPPASHIAPLLTLCWLICTHGKELEFFSLRAFVHNHKLTWVIIWYMPASTIDSKIHLIMG